MKLVRHSANSGAEIGAVKGEDTRSVRTHRVYGRQHDRTDRTPGGVGLAMRPPQWLKAGDRVRVEIDRIGAIEAVVRPEGHAR